MNTQTFKFEFGDEVKDMVSGLTGIIVGKHFYLTGCARYSVQPPTTKKENKIPDAFVIDETTLQLLKAGKVKMGPIKQEVEKTPGPPMQRTPAQRA